MARVKYGGTVQEIRGRVEGLVYSRNGSSAFVRGQKKPINPRSDMQSLQRLYMTVAIDKWRATDPSDKALWNAYALAPPETDYDPFGDVRLLSGYQWALRVWCRQQTTGDTLIDTPGSDVPVVGPTGLSFVYDVGGGTAVLSYDDTSFSAGDSLIVEAVIGRLGTQSVSYAGFYLVWFAAPSTSTSTDIYSAINGFIGQVQVGQYIGLRVYRQTSEGIRSPVQQINEYGT